MTFIQIGCRKTHWLKETGFHWLKETNNLTFYWRSRSFNVFRDLYHLHMPGTGLVSMKSQVVYRGRESGELGSMTAAHCDLWSQEHFDSGNQSIMLLENHQSPTVLRLFHDIVGAWQVSSMKGWSSPPKCSGPHRWEWVAPVEHSYFNLYSASTP